MQSLCSSAKRLFVARRCSLASSSFFSSILVLVEACQQFRISKRLSRRSKGMARLTLSFSERAWRSPRVFFSCETYRVSDQLAKEIHRLLTSLVDGLLSSPPSSSS